jgi:hypothetical protein
MIRLFMLQVRELIVRYNEGEQFTHHLSACAAQMMLNEQAYPPRDRAALSTVPIDAVPLHQLQYRL